jgi:chromosomal replication initiation ATPase DnaA
VSFQQLALPFAHAPAFNAIEFLEAPSNADALAWLARTSAWPGGRLALCGEASVGKTHLLHIWAGRAAARLLPGASLTAMAAYDEPAAPLAIDDADAAAPEALLHVLNAASEARQPVLLAARQSPAHWEARWSRPLADLSSRLRAVLAVPIGPPEETLLRSLFARLLAERQIAVPEHVQDWMLLRLPRSPAALHEAAHRFDRASLDSGRGATRAIAARVIADMTAPPADHEDFAQPARHASPGHPRVL